MITLRELKKLLADRRIPVIASATGISYHTIRDIRDNPDANPTYKILSGLNDYFERNK